jgi:FlaA1/EpsC-like NDP-sugar epimerase
MEEKLIQQNIANKTILVTGGTGSFGSYLVEKLIAYRPKKLIVFSRDEQKQYELKKKLASFDQVMISFVIGDVRNINSLLDATRGVDIIYHTAAMKHVPICEENPIEAVYTNVLGAYNLREVAIRNSVKKVIAISTDKAVRSVNVMGMSKAIQERILLAKNNSTTKFICVRFGNVVGSRGSVVPLFKELLAKGKPLPLTDVHMTRFLIDFDNAFELICTATVLGEGREIFVKKMPACKIQDLAEVMAKEIAHKSNYPMHTVGLREGEQTYETLISEEEVDRTKEEKSFYVIYPYGTIGIKQPVKKISEYRTDLVQSYMSRDEIQKLLRKEGWI